MKIMCGDWTYSHSVKILDYMQFFLFHIENILTK